MIKSEFKDAKLYFLLCNKIDSANSDEVNKEILDIVEKYPVEKFSDLNVIIDCNDLNYISSSGLRIVLSLKKKYKNLECINLSNSVYEIFETTGFNEIIKISKKRKNIDVSNCQAIGQGATGVVYKLDNDTAIKVFRKDVSEEVVLKERMYAKKAFLCGIPTAISYDIVNCGDALGAIYEMINAESLSVNFEKHPEKFDYFIKLYVDLLKQMSSSEVEDDAFPNEKEFFCKHILTIPYLKEDVVKHITDIINAVPDKKSFVHLDCMTKNILIKDNELLMIDMGDVGYGHSVFNFASIKCAVFDLDTFELIKAPYEKIVGMKYETGKKVWDALLNAYFIDLDEQTKKEVINTINVYSRIRFLGLIGIQIPYDRFDQADLKNALEMVSNELMQVDVNKLKFF
ncbi:MAG: STAS domain-containing protein [Alphaproteobacteria bacterium]|nr:STAS domain-containing protein [Alphaproteobacteria bacterium]